MPSRKLADAVLCVESIIEIHEGQYADFAYADFRDGLRQQDTFHDKLAYCRCWTSMYQRIKEQRVDDR